MKSPKGENIKIISEKNEFSNRAHAMIASTLKN